MPLPASLRWRRHRMVTRTVMKHSEYTDNGCGIILLNSPGGSILQWSAGRDLLYTASVIETWLNDDWWWGIDVRSYVSITIIVFLCLTTQCHYYIFFCHFQSLEVSTCWIKIQTCNIIVVKFRVNIVWRGRLAVCLHTYRQPKYSS